MKIAMTIVTIILSFVTLIVMLIFVHRLTLPYNSEGRFFDESSLTVYHEQAVITYGLLAFCGLSLTLVAFYKTRKVFYK